MITLPLPLIGAMAPASRAESRTAESIWSQSDARQQAIEQIPLKDRKTITETRCEEVGMPGMSSLPRFRCTVWFDPTPDPAKPMEAP